MKHAAALIALGVAVFAGGALVAGSGALSSDPSNRGAAAPGQSIPAPTPTAELPPPSEAPIDRIAIPRFGVEAAIVTLGVNADGVMETPDGPLR